MIKETNYFILDTYHDSYTVKEGVVKDPYWALGYPDPSKRGVDWFIKDSQESPIVKIDEHALCRATFSCDDPSEIIICHAEKRVKNANNDIILISWEDPNTTPSIVSTLLRLSLYSNFTALQTWMTLTYRLPLVRNHLVGVPDRYATELIEGSYFITTLKSDDKVEPKEMTVAQLEKELGYSIKIVGETNGDQRSETIRVELY